MITIIMPSAKEPNAIEMLKETSATFPEAQIIVSTDRYRRGKGWATREALREARGDIIVFMDSDGDISPHMIRRLLPHLDEFDIVVGTKDTRVLISRWILSIMARLYISLMFGIPVETQTGLKVFRRHSLPDWEEDSFAFDVEILAKAKKLGIRMFEVKIDTRTTRKMKLKSIWAALIGSLKIWRSLKHGKISIQEKEVC